MAVPTKKISKSRTRKRHSERQNIQLKKLMQKTTLTKCVQCGAVKRAHHVCSACGYYRGKQVKTIKTKKEAVLDA
jgi:large subunit ribosomal protein L32